MSLRNAPTLAKCNICGFSWFPHTAQSIGCPECRAVELQKFADNGIELFLNPCEKHTGENAVLWDIFKAKYADRCHFCDFEELDKAKAEIERLTKRFGDGLDTIFAMLVAARGKECDIDTLEAEINKVSTKPSEYIKHVITERDKLIEQMKDALQWYKEQVSSCNRNGDAGELARDRLAKDVGKRAEAALSAAERMGK